MRRVLNAFGVVVLVAAAFTVGARTGKRDLSSTAKAQPKSGGSVRYICPMHPQYTSDRPGDAPCCGMRLEPVQADGTLSAHSDGGLTGGKRGLPLGVVEVSLEKQQLIGVEVARARRSAVRHVVRTTGRVAVDENRIYRLVAGVEGRILQIYPSTTGTLVRKGAPLATLYGRDPSTSQQAYLYALSALDRYQEAARVPVPNEPPIAPPSGAAGRGGLRAEVPR